MKKLYILLIALAMSQMTSAQISGTYTIPGAPYATIAAAIAAINTSGIGAGGATFNVTAGYTETFATGTAGYITTTTGSVTNFVKFQKSGSGANPLITAPTGTGTMDAIIAIAGTDYVTFDGINLQENAANLTTTTQMEWGYAILKASATDGSQNITIKNCTITLNKTNTATYGIYSNNHTTASTTQLTVTAVSGQNSSNKFYTNTITNSYGGLYLNGFSDALFPYLYYDQNNDIGSLGGNTFTNLGGGGVAVYGIYASYENGLKIVNNIFSGPLTCTTTAYLIYTGTGNNANIDIYSNNLTCTFTGSTNTLYGIYNGIGGSGVSNTLNLYNNTVSINYATATTGALYCIYTSAGALNCNITGNNVINNVLGSASTAGTGVFAGLYTFGANTLSNSVWLISGNVISGNSRVQSTFSTGSGYMLYNSSSGMSLTVYNNSVFNNSCPGSSANYCIYISTSSPLSLIVRKNIIHDNSKPNAVINVLPRSSSLYGIYVNNSLTLNTTTVDSNSVYNQTNTWGGQLLGIRGETSATGTININNNSIYSFTANDQAIFGVYNSVGLYVNMFRNNLYNLSAAIGDSASFYGLCAGSSSTSAITTVYNNFISDLRAPEALNYLCAGLYAFSATAGTTIRFYYNTVVLKQTATAGGPATSCVFAQVAPTVEMKNNILYNNATIFGGGLTICYWRGAATPGTYTAASGFNCMYAGTPGASNLIFFDFTNSDQTMAAYKARFPQEAQSFTETPPFVNIAATPYNLHMQTSIATGCESGGQTVTIPAITTDYDLQARYPNPGYPVGGYAATAPDVGADEFGGLMLDVVPPVIVYTPLANTSSLVARTITATITDQTGVPTSGAGLPRLYWKINAGSWNSSVATSLGGNQYLFSFGAGALLGDVVSYYVVAQDNLATPLVTSVPLAGAAGFTYNPPAAGTPPTTPYTYTIVGGLCGTYNVGSGQTYTTLTAAIADLNIKEITCPVVFLLKDAAYPSETFPIVINSILGSSAVNTVTIKPATGVTPTISGASATSILKINQAKYIYIDGANTVGGTTRDLTISNTTVSGTTAAVWIGSNGTGLGSTNISVSNCKLLNGFNTSASYGIFVGSSVGIGTSGDDNDNITLQNNLVTKSYYGIYTLASAAGMDDNLLISGNTLGTALATDYLGYYGIYLSGANVPVVTGNEVFNIITTTSSNIAGILLYSSDLNAVVKSNKIHDLLNNNSSGWGSYGIDVGTGGFVYNAQLINNLIYNITTVNYSTASTTYNPFGIRIAGSGGHKLYHNTVNLSGTQFASGASGTLSAALLVTSAGIGGMDIRDNIFANGIVGLAGSTSYAIYAPGGTPFPTINYNDYWGYGTYGILGYYGSNILNLAGWQAVTGQDVNSKNIDPLFVSAIDLHPTNAGLAKAGIYLPTVTTDFAGAFRTDPPDIGAYQFSANQSVVTVAASGITLNTAFLNGTINANNATVTSGFEYGLTTAYGTSVAGVPASVTGSVATPINALITGLSPCTLYHYRAIGTSGALTVNGNDMTFNTTNAIPTATTNPATGISGTGATLNGSVNANTISTTVTFDYGLTTAYGTTVPGVPGTVTGSSPTGVTAIITGLLPGNLYHFRVNGTNICGTTNGTDLTFTTPATLPTAITNPATGLGSSTATLNGTITANGASTTVVFNYGLTAAYGSTVPGVPSPVTGNTATAVTASLTGLTLNTTYHFQVCGTNSVGTSCGGDLQFTTGCPVAGPAGPITGPNQVCQGGCGYVYSVAPIANATGYSWTLPVGGSITAGANTNSITVCYAANASPGYVLVYGTALCGNGSPSQLAVAMNPPAAPTLSGPASVCVNSTGNVYTTQAGMSNYVWSVSAGGVITAGGTPSSNTVTVNWLTTGAKTVCVNYNSAAGCPALAPVCYNVTVNPLPVPTITGPASACTNVPCVGYSTQAGMTNYIWTVSAGGSITSGQGTNSICVTWNVAGAQTVSVNYTNANGCTAAAAVVYNVTVNNGAAPTITGATNVCVYSGYYNYSTQTGMTAYTWTISPGGVINFGGGTSTVTVTWNAVGAQWIRVNYTNPAGCSAYNPTQLNVTVNPLPDAAGSITGTSDVCAGATGIAYSVAPVANAVTYVWTLPAGASIASGSGTNSITVDFASNASPGNITVYANNICGNGAASAPFPVAIDPLPAPAGTITGQSVVCQGETGVVYTVPVIVGALGYSWNFPSGATPVNGTNTNSITLNYGPSAVSGVINVYGTNNCGNGQVSPDFNVTVNATPATPVIILHGDTLISSAPAGNQWYFMGVIIPGATSQTYVAPDQGEYWDIVTLNGCSSDTSNHIFLVVGISHIGSGSFAVYPVPNEGQFIASMTSSSKEFFTISVYNDFGVKIFEKTNIEVKGIVSQPIDLRPISDGVYSVVFRSIQGQLVKRIIVRK